MRKLLTIMTLVAALLICSSCYREKNTSGSQTPNPTESHISNPIDSQTPNPDGAGAWESVSGCYVREDSSQYNNAVLQMKYLSNNCAMFEFRLMEGSESEDIADTLVLPFVLLVGEDGVGRYETLPESEKSFSIALALSEDGQSVTVTHTGELSISPDGVYTFINNSLEVSEVSAIAILDHLPAAATSLNQNNGAYTIQYPEELIADWFYPVQAVFDDNSAVLAKFLIAKDLSAVYRADDDIEPALIFGSAQPMLDAETIPFREEEDEGSEEIPEWADQPQPLVRAELEGGVNLSVGQESRLTVMMPWKLPYTLTTESSDKSVVDVDDNGMVKAVSEGQATISGTITVDDGKKEFSIEVSVESDRETEQAEIL